MLVVTRTTEESVIIDFISRIGEDDMDGGHRVGENFQIVVEADGVEIESFGNIGFRRIGMSIIFNLQRVMRLFLADHILAHKRHIVRGFRGDGP